MKETTFVGVDVGGTNIRAALVKNGKIGRRLKLETLVNQGLAKSIEQIKSAIRPLVDKASGVGIGIAGIIDSEQGVVKFSPNFKEWHNVHLASILKKEFKKPVRIINDVNAILLGEWQYGAAKGHDNVFLFTLGTGVGGAAICEGRPLFGVHGFAGEFGHTIIKFDGPKCSCGNHGCLERYVGAKYIVDRARHRIKMVKSSSKNYRKLTPEIIAKEAGHGDKVAKEIFLEIGYYLGVGVTNIIHLFDPNIVIISGGIARAGKLLFEPIKRTVARMVLGANCRAYKIVPAHLGDDAGILGAVYFAAKFTHTEDL